MCGIKGIGTFVACCAFVVDMVIQARTNIFRVQNSAVHLSEVPRVQPIFRRFVHDIVPRTLLETSMTHFDTYVDVQRTQPVKSKHILHIFLVFPQE